MKEWWNNLALREKQMLSVGFFFLALLVFYLLILSPLNNKTDSLRQQISRNKTLLNWMEVTDKQLTSLATTSQQPKPTDESLLNLVQKKLKSAALSDFVSDLHQYEADSVQIVFQKVPFDKLISWLINLNKQDGINIIQMSVTPSAKPGIVAADLVLK